MSMVQRSRKWQDPHTLRNVTVKQLQMDPWMQAVLTCLKVIPAGPGQQGPHLMYMCLVSLCHCMSGALFYISQGYALTSNVLDAMRILSLDPSRHGVVYSILMGKLTCISLLLCIKCEQICYINITQRPTFLSITSPDTSNFKARHLMQGGGEHSGPVQTCHGRIDLQAEKS